MILLSRCNGPAVPAARQGVILTTDAPIPAVMLYGAERSGSAGYMREPD